MNENMRLCLYMSPVSPVLHTEVTVNIWKIWDSIYIQWGSVYRAFEYWKHLNTGNIWILETFEYWTFWSLDFKWSVYVLCTRPTIQILYLYLRKQDGVDTSGIQMAFKYQTIWHPTSFRPFKYRRSSVFSSPTVFK